MALARCLDKEAFCEISVDQVSKSKVSKRPTFGRPSKLAHMAMEDAQDIENLSPTNHKTTSKTKYNVVQ